jgi:post-segregation antitoxin (ccd killing protein)
MVSLEIKNDGAELVHTNVRVPRALHTLAKEHGVKMSAVLTEALESRFEALK